MYAFNLHLKEWSMDNNMVSKIWIGMSTTNFDLLQFKIQVTCKNTDFEYGTSELIR